MAAGGASGSREGGGWQGVLPRQAGGFYRAQHETISEAANG